MNKKTLITAGILLLVAALLLGAYYMLRPKTQEGAKTITVTVVHKDGTEKKLTCHTDETYLGPVLRAEGLITEEGMINIVDGETADWNADKSYWALYDGENYASVGAEELAVVDGAAYKLVYTLGE